MYLDKQKYTTSVVTIREGDKVILNREVSFPEHFKPRARQIVTHKYFQPYETSLKEVVTRVVKWYQDKFSKAYKNKIKLIKKFIPEIKSAKGFAQYLYDNIMAQNFSFNSPVWFNLGVPGREDQVSACFINSVEDSLESLLYLNVDEGMIFKGGSGSGVNMSIIRAKGEPLSNGGTSSGMLSFIRPADSWGGSIKSGGTTRRSAKMVVGDEDHPDIVEFVECKTRQEEIAKVLKDAGYNGEFNGEIYTEILAYQNANHSVRISDATMRKLDKFGSEANVIQTYRVSGKEASRINASKLIDLISYHAHKTGEPGIQFKDTINRYHTCKEDGEIRASNPCSEYFFLDDTACNLASINIKNVYDPNNMEKYITLVKVLTLAMDLAVDSYYPTSLIADVNPNYRTLGLGVTNVGAYLMSQGLPYGEKVANKVIKDICYHLTLNSYMTSTYLAEWLEPFPRFEANKESFLEVIEDMFSKNGKELMSRIEKHGIRNAQVTAIAPTGTISFMMDADTFGIEPLFALGYTKTLAGGGEQVTDNFDCVREAREKLKFEGNDHPVLATASSETNTIPYMSHLSALASAQEYITGGISKTVNLPESATVETITNIYHQSWLMGIKSITVYRNKSKGVQPINLPEICECEDGELVPAGTCTICTNCGKQSGCS